MAWVLNRLIGRGAISFVAAFALAGGAMAQEVGKASAVNPAATANLRTIAIGASITHKERIKTTEKGSVQILFVDKTSMTIGPNSDLTIDEYVYDPNAGSGKLAATLGKGALRFVGGQISHTGDAEVKTASATIGIRGGVAMIGPGYVFAGYGHSTVTTGGGSVTLGAGEFTQTPGGGQPPSPPAPPPPNFVQQQIQMFQSGAGQSGGAGQGVATRGNVQQAENRATGQQGGSVAGSLTPTPPPPPVPPINALASTLTQTVQTSVQQSAAHSADVPTETPSAPRPTVTLTGFFGGLMSSFLKPSSNISTGTVGGSATVSLDATSGRVQSSFDGSVTRNPYDTNPNRLPGAVAYRYDSVAYGNYDNFGAGPATQTNGQPASTIDNLPIQDHTGAMVVLSGASAQYAVSSIQPGVTACACDYTRWGFWSSTSQQQIGTSNYQDTALGYWVAGRAIGANEVPLSGTASYAGHVIGNVSNAGIISAAAGNLSTTVDFGTRTGTAAVTGFDGVNYAGSLGLGITDPRMISASLAGGGRTMTLDGSFFRGVASPVGEMGGSMAVTGSNYLASGIFAAKMK